MRDSMCLHIGYDLLDSRFERIPVAMRMCVDDHSIYLEFSIREFSESRVRKYHDGSDSYLMRESSYIESCFYTVRSPSTPIYEDEGRGIRCEIREFEESSIRTIDIADSEHIRDIDIVRKAWIFFPLASLICVDSCFCPDFPVSILSIDDTDCFRKWKHDRLPPISRIDESI